MRVRNVLIGTALLSAILGAVVAYLVLTVPNDVQASAIMRTAKEQMAAGDNDGARQSLSRIVQQFPRTDAAAAATVALVTLADNERHKLKADLDALQRQEAALQKQVTAQTDRVQSIENRPVPAPVVIHEAAPVAKKAPAKKSSKKHRKHH